MLVVKHIIYMLGLVDYIGQRSSCGSITHRNPRMINNYNSLTIYYEIIEAKQSTQFIVAAHGFDRSPLEFILPHYI